MAGRDDSHFQQKRKGWYNKTFANNIFSTNIAVYRYLADLLFEGDLNRVVWASNDMLFQRRQAQVNSLIKQGKLEDSGGTLAFPFCGFRLIQDAASATHERRWQNQALNVEGVWLEELGRKVRITPMTLIYEAIFCCQDDIDIQYITTKALWDDSNETLLEAWIDTESEKGETKTLKNIVVCSTTAHMNDQFSEADWLTKNRIQTVRFELKCGTWLMGDDRRRYGIAKNIWFNFATQAYFPISLRGTIDHEKEEINWREDVYKAFSWEGIWGDKA